ncbi:hypothetical protein Tco_1006364 [Tanacetum coccineum]|uniref:Uncharacterized protein n=1 Tax=Tanacetum coccineum TaxID=301880 RepID=A0ABQ5FHN7_9ASTR
MIQPEPEGSTQGYPLDIVEVLRYDTKGEKVDPHIFEGTNKDGNREFRYSDIVRTSRSDEVLKLKNFEKDASLQLSSCQIKKGMSMSVPKSQVSQDDKDYKMAKRDYAWLMIS